MKTIGDAVVNDVLCQRRGGESRNRQGRGLAVMGCTVRRGANASTTSGQVARRGVLIREIVRIFEAPGR